MGPVAAVVAPAAIQAGGQLVGSALSGKANKEASKIQARSASEALQVARDNEARRRQEYDKAEAASKAQWDAEQARLAPYRAAKDALLRSNAGRLGLDLGSLGGAYGASGVGSTPPPGWVPGASGSSQPKTLASLAGLDVGPEIQAAPRLTLADIANWGSQRRQS